MTNSRFLAIFAAIGAIASVVAGLTSIFPPKYTTIAAAVAAIVGTLTERIQGGKSTATSHDVHDNVSAGRIR